MLSFSQEGSVISVDLSAMPNQDDVLQQTAVANTLLQNFEASELNLSVNGEKLGTMEFNKGYKNIGSKTSAAETEKESAAESGGETAESSQETEAE